MAANTSIPGLFDALTRAASTIRSSQESRSADWFVARMQSLMGDKSPNGLTYDNLVRDKANKLVSAQALDQIGSMYMFLYDAKWKETLPYWDSVPLIFIVRRMTNGFIGINLHYLPIDYRSQLFKALMDISIKNKGTPQQLRLSYALLMGTARLRYAKPCIKYYLYSRLRSRVLNIDPKYWETAMYLPTDKFMKSTKRKVWADSRKIIGDPTFNRVIPGR